MSYVFTLPETLEATAARVGSAGADISTARTNAATAISTVATAADDEVSQAIREVFNAFGREYQQAIGQASAFASEFSAYLSAAAKAYLATETGNLALAVSGALGGFSGATGTWAPITSSTATSVALIMGWTNTPLPPWYAITGLYQSFLQQILPNAVPTGLWTPEQFWPVTPFIGNTMTFGQSLAQGVSILNNALHTNLAAGHDVGVFAYSQSSAIATESIRQLMAHGSPNTANLQFVLTGNPNTPDGGILSRFPGFYIPILDVMFNGATPANSPYLTHNYTLQYDGIANAPRYPLNVLSDVNAIMGYFYVHNQYPLLSALDVGNAIQLPTSPGYTGHTSYYMIPTQNLPLVQPIRNIPVVGPALADLIQPNLRVLVDLGYSNYGSSYANVTTPAGFFSLPDPFTVIPALANGTIQGFQGAAVDLGLLPASMYPNSYPFVPSLNPGLNINLGQQQTTLLGSMSGALGNLFRGDPGFPSLPVF